MATAFSDHGGAVDPAQFAPATLRRQGRAPLRFRGCEVARKTAKGAGGVAVDLALYARQDRRWSVALHQRSAEGERRDAATCPTLAAVCDWVEESCTRKPGPGEPAAATANDLLLALERRMTAAGLAALTAEIAGAALAEWPVRFAQTQTAPRKER